VSLGALTIRLELAVVESIWLTLGEAIQRLDARRQRASRADADLFRAHQAEPQRPS
jgi:hypothetical protein